MGAGDDRERSVRVLVAVPWDQREGGVASVVRNLGMRLEGTGHEIVFLHPGEHGGVRERRTACGFRGFEVRLRGPSIAKRPLRSRAAFLATFPTTVFRLRRLLRRLRTDVVNIHYPTPHFFSLTVAARLLRIPVVVSIHGADLFPSGRPRTRYTFATRAVLRAASRIVAPSQSLLDDFDAVFPTLARRGVVIHNGLDAEEFAGIQPTPDARWDARSILCIAEHNDKKGIDILLRAFAGVLETEADLTLTLVGDGPLRAEHDALAADLGIGRRVTCYRTRTRGEIGALLRACDAFVLPSRAEPFGIVLLEAMAFGRPVVASAVGGIPEVVEPERSGILVPPDDVEALGAALRRVLVSRDLRQRLGEGGIQRVNAHFRAEHNGARYEELFVGVLGLR